MLYGLLNAAAEVGSQGGSTAISVSRHSPAGASGRWTGSVCFKVSWRPTPVALMTLQESLDLIRAGAFTPGAELALVGLAARMCSCGFEAPSDGLSVSFIARAMEGTGAG
jgi:hypothetical protein